MSKKRGSPEILQEAIDLALEASRQKFDQSEFFSSTGEWRRVRRGAALKAHLRLRLSSILDMFEAYRRITPTELRETIQRIRGHLKQAVTAHQSLRESLVAATTAISAAEAVHIESVLPDSLAPLGDLLDQIQHLLVEEEPLDLGDEVLAEGINPSPMGVLERIIRGCDQVLGNQSAQRGRRTPLSPTGVTPERELIEQLWWTWFENVGIPDLGKDRAFERWVELVLQLLPTRGDRPPTLEDLKRRGPQSKRGMINETHAQCLSQLQVHARKDPVLLLPGLDQSLPRLEGNPHITSEHVEQLKLSIRHRHRRAELLSILDASPTRKRGRPKKSTFEK